LDIGSQSVVASSITPLWLSANKTGLVQEGAAFQNLSSLGIGVFYEPIEKIELALKGTLHLRSAPRLDAFFNTLYLDASYTFLQFRAGWFNETIGEVERDLSSGSMALSENARPMPRLELRIKDWLILPYTQDKVAVKAGITHGWFEQERPAKDVLLHGKWVYGRLGDEDQYVKGGLVHFAQWAGSFYDPLNPSVWVSSPATIPNLWQAFVAGGAATGGTALESFNAYGNHLGIWDFSTGISVHEWKLSGYYQHFFEDKGSLDTWSNGLDGLFGFSVRAPESIPALRSVLIEYIDTTDQSGPVEQINIDGSGLVHIYGGDSYYYNYIYRNGWSYLGRILGTPLITGSGTGDQFRIDSNRVKGNHYGLALSYGDFDAIILYTDLMRFPAFSEKSIVPAKNMVEKMDYRNHKDRKDGYLRILWNGRGTNRSAPRLSIYAEGALGYDELFGWNYGFGFGGSYGLLR
jgi:hypothetical protein